MKFINKKDGIISYSDKIGELFIVFRMTSVKPDINNSSIWWKTHIIEVKTKSGFIKYSLLLDFDDNGKLNNISFSSSDGSRRVISLFNGNVLSDVIKINSSKIIYRYNFDNKKYIDDSGNSLKAITIMDNDLLKTFIDCGFDLDFNVNMEYYKNNSFPKAVDLDFKRKL